MIIEEKVMDSMNLSPSEVSGLSGIWSFMFSTFLLLTMEDTYDTIIMIKNNSIILILSIVSIAIFAIWTILSLKITQNASAIARMVFDQLTIAIVWIIQIFIHWIITGTEYEEKYAKAGEEWTKWSWLQMVGFAVMVFGAYVYQGIVKIPARKQTDTERLLQNNDPPLI
ncbi:Drug/Metabolite Transporter (DMT) Superfamily [Histomonas meleagridis]|uniref:Drug/Metabolite Transporter (DMT) Superfamily n=1 Tax=Histomonas meleagridis TaxID=135588 RepID=UPI0035599DA7|nr:Drug/Metabolite Transporter (DMT) Superfamily [Histomonas meleagridis]KAH0802108.1 Drug/Metabolite Transporter (DMT) Superfamily [Histomonas meleagridis]